MTVCLPWTKNHWARSNLYRNPFGELTRDQRIEVAIVDVESLVERVSKPWYAIQFIGQCGRGKTTRMLKLASRLPASTYTYLAEDGHCPAIPSGDPVLIDEAQRLPGRVRSALFLTGIPMVLATHRDLFRPLKRAGYAVKTERIGSSNSPELLCQILNRRIEAARLTKDPIPVVTIDFARQLVRRFGTNIRGIESHLYELVQTQVTDHGQMRFDD